MNRKVSIGLNEKLNFSGLMNRSYKSKTPLMVNNSVFLSNEPKIIIILEKKKHLPDYL